MRQEHVERQKARILSALLDSKYDLSIEEIVQSTKMSRHTVAKYLQALIGEKKVRISRILGKAVLHEPTGRDEER